MKKALDKGWHLPIMFSLFGAFFTYMIVRDLGTGEIWRGPGGVPDVITLAKKPADFYVMIFFFSAMALTFWGGVIWTLFLLFRSKPK